MVYDSFDAKFVDRFLGMFYAHRDTINDKYGRVVGRQYISDRERFVDRIARMFEGKCVVLVDHMLHGVYQGMLDDRKFYAAINPEVSVYSKEYNRPFCGAEPVFRTVLRYLQINGVQAVNQLYGRGYICVNAMDEHGVNLSFVLNRSTMDRLQFRVISHSQFCDICEMFADDRTEVEYVGKRRLMFSEMVERKLCRKNCALDKLPVVYEDVHVSAVDRDAAYDKFREEGYIVESIELA